MSLNFTQIQFRGHRGCGSSEEGKGLEEEQGAHSRLLGAGSDCCWFLLSSRRKWAMRVVCYRSLRGVHVTVELGFSIHPP